RLARGAPRTSSAAPAQIQYLPGGWPDRPCRIRNRQQQIGRSLAKMADPHRRQRNHARILRWRARCSEGPRVRSRLEGTVDLRPPASESLNQGGTAVSNIKESLTKIMQLDGALGSCVVDSNSGMMLGSDGGSGPVNLEVAAAGNTEVVRAKRKTMKALNL